MPVLFSKGADMKPRARSTYKILAVALTATAGCGPTVAATSSTTPEPARTEMPVVTVGPTASESSQPPAQPEAPAPAATADSPQAPSAVATAQSPSAPAFSNDPKLLALRTELLAKDRSSAMAQSARFLPLCDKDGYPLVGNLIRKGDPVKYQPSQFCQEVRRGSPR
jgi:hypothetical protein